LTLLPAPPLTLPRKLPRLEATPRTGTLLRPHPAADGYEGEVCGLNLLSGCPHRCTFCFARAYPGYPGDDLAYLYANTADRLRQELQERRKRPQAVYLCPSTDPFPPFAAVQAEAVRVLEVLAEFGVEAWFMTRGYIRPSAVEALARHKELVRVTVGLTTVDRNLQRVIEPLAAPPRLRLRQMADLRDLGIKVQATVDPLLPGITDTRANLEPVVNALADAGITHLSTGYAFLRTGIAENLQRDLGPLGWSGPVLEAFQGGPVLGSAGIAAARYLPRAVRQRGYALLMALAANRGLTVNVSSLTNPDFTPTRPAHPPVSLRQLVLQYPRSEERREPPAS
jgi:DNA repair photolyase